MDMETISSRKWTLTQKIKVVTTLLSVTKKKNLENFQIKNKINKIKMMKINNLIIKKMKINY